MNQLSRMMNNMTYLDIPLEFPNVCIGSKKNAYLGVFTILTQLWINAHQDLYLHSFDNLTLENDDSLCTTLLC